MGLTDFARNIAGAGATAGASSAPSTPSQVAPIRPGDAPPAWWVATDLNTDRQNRINANNTASLATNYDNDPNTFYGAIDTPNTPSVTTGYDPFFEMMKANLANEQSWLTQSHNLDMAGLNLNKSFLGPNRDNALALLGLDRENLGLDRERLGLARQGTNVDEGDVRRGADTKIRGINQDFTSRGSWFAPEKGAQVGDTYAQRDADLKRIDLRRQGLDVDEKGIGISERGIGLREQGVINQFNQQMAKYGLDEKKMNAYLQQQLGSLGIQAGDDLLKQMLGGIEGGGEGGAMMEWILGMLLPGWFG